MNSERFTGRVIWFSDEKGFGFIRPDGSDEDGDIFLHWTYLKVSGFKSVKADSIVSYEIGENHRGEMAIDVEVESEG